NIIFGSIIDDEMGDEVRVTVIAAGFDRWDDTGKGLVRARSANGSDTSRGVTSFDDTSGSLSGVSSSMDDLDLDSDDEFDVPSFLK
ncbi:MAG TPA: cell division protein FtsZ, partial [Acidimicrobiales bacterium]|nr:cell division protein FtsZ [Acidimicrobiales bacterium]